MAKILVADSIAKEGISLLEKHHELVVSTGLKEDALCEAIKDAEALVVRSQTQVTEKVIAAAPKLQIIARAGVGVDNVDVKSATAAGVALGPVLGARIFRERGRTKQQRGGSNGETQDNGGLIR